MSVACVFIYNDTSSVLSMPNPAFNYIFDGSYREKMVNLLAWELVLLSSRTEGLEQQKTLMNVALGKITITLTLPVSPSSVCEAHRAGGPNSDC